MCNGIELGPTTKKKIKTLLWEKGQLKTRAYCPLQFEAFPCAFSVMMMSKTTWESFLAAYAIASF